jgi:hypothetical protein
MGLSSITTDNLYVPNQLYSFATAAFVTASYFSEKSKGNNPDNVEYFRDVFIHLGQSLLRKDGYFGLKIDALSIDWKLALPGAKNVMRLANIGRISEIIYKAQQDSSTIPDIANLIDGSNHGINLIMTEASGKKEEPKLLSLKIS